MTQNDERGLAALEPLSEELHAKVKADAINALIAPPHPEKTSVNLRLGQTKKGHAMLYEPGGSGGWKLFGAPKVTDLKELRQYAELLIQRRIPGGPSLFYYEPE